MRLIYKILLLVVVVFIVYYPSLFAGYNSVDDLKMVTAVSNNSNWELRTLFFPDGGYYYRPVLFLTFLLDHDFANMNPQFMHLENVIFHLLNVLLIYLISHKLLARKGDGLQQWLPLITSLLFAWHPINTESVNWISGRTDLMACLFILAALYFILLSCDLGKSVLLVPALLFFMLGCLSKETTVFFLPAAMWIALTYNQDFSYRDLLTAFRRRSFHLLGLVLVCAGYFALRSMALKNHDSGIAHVAGNVLAKSNDLLDSFRILLKVLGFYVKKLLWPWPLNFGIIDVSDGYVVVGFVLLLLCCVWLIKPSIENALFLMSTCIMSSALLVALGSAAWTPIGERYLYISSAPFAMAAVMSGARLKIFQCRSRYSVGVLIFILAICSISTFQRNIVWQDNATLFYDTVEKSPDFIPARNELVAALVARGEIEKARPHLDIVYAKGTPKGYSPSYLNKAKFLAQDKEYYQARNLLLKHFDSTHKNHVHVLKALILVNQEIIKQTQSEEAKRIIYDENLIYLHDLKKITKDPFNDYRIAKIYLKVGKKSMARDYFLRAYNHAKVGAHYKEPARKLAVNLANEISD